MTSPKNSQAAALVLNLLRNLDSITPIDVLKEALRIAEQPQKTCNIHFCTPGTHDLEFYSDLTREQVKSISGVLYVYTSYGKLYVDIDPRYIIEDIKAAIERMANAQ